MAIGTASNVYRHLRPAARGRDGDGPTDGQLLEGFITRRDGAAFEMLVRRHGPMVLGVCRRVVGNVHDAEDAFQATFLVLVRKAASLGSRELVGNWLYGVAHRTALEAKAKAARRRARERQVEPMPQPAAEPESAWQGLQPLLDRELQRLPEKYRLPVVLCDLEGRSRKEVARHLNLPEGTLSSRLAFARKRLADRLTRHGLALSGGAVAAALAQGTAAARVPAPLVLAVVRTGAAVGPAAVTDLVSAEAAALADGTLEGMFMAKLRVVTAVFLAVFAVGIGGTVLTHLAPAQQKPAPGAAKEPRKEEARKDAREVTGTLQAVDAAKNTITLGGSKAFPFPGAQTLEVAKGAKVWIADGTGEKLGFSEGKLADLAQGAIVTFKLADDQKTVAGIWAEGPSLQGVLKTVDADKSSITVSVHATKVAPAVEQTFAVAKAAWARIDHGKGKTFNEVRLADLKPGVLVTLKLSGDLKRVGDIWAQGPSITGVLKAVEAGKNTITLTVSEDGGMVDKTFEVAKDVQIHIDDGKERKSSTKEGRLADLTVGALVTVQLALDPKVVTAIRAEAVSVAGTLKAVDAGKHTLSLTVFRKKGEPSEDTTFKTAEDVKVWIDGKEGKLADLPAECSVSVRLSADQKSAVIVRAEGPSISGEVKATADGSITIGGKTGDQTFTVAKDVVVLIGAHQKGKLSDQKAKLGDLIAGTLVSMKLTADGQQVIGPIVAQGLSFQGVVKGVDPEKNTLVVTVGARKGAEAEDKTVTTTKDTAVVTAINGVALRMADVKVGKQVVVRLTLDQKSVATITILGE